MNLSGRFDKDDHPKEELTSFFEAGAGRLVLSDGSRVGVIGGGPAGSFFGFFLLKMADSLGLAVSVDIYEPRFFNHSGPAGCNHCGGIVSESLVQLLATEGIRLPPTVVQHGIDSYTLHMDVGDVRIDTPLFEKRIAGVFRGNGPREGQTADIDGLDRHLLQLVSSAGANVVRKLVCGIDWQGGKPVVSSPDGSSQAYDLVAVATGVNSQAFKLFQEASTDYKPPRTLKSFICEFHLGRNVIEQCLGSSMHVFLLDLPHVKFAALVPKNDFATLCVHGDQIDDRLIERFFSAPEVKRCFPGSVVPRPVCHCFPRVNLQAAVRPYADRIVWVGDCGAARLYKDGIGSAYRTAKAAAKTAVFHGISADDFKRHFWPACRELDFDNSIAKLVFAATRLIQRARFLRRAVLRMSAVEQSREGRRRHMSSVLWDVFTGSAPYRDVLLRSFHPGFQLSLIWNLIAGNLAFWKRRRMGGQAS